MKIQELFAADVTRAIPPVVYFHEQDPEKLAAEVGEYIITGGYPEGDPRGRRMQSGAGIHEQLVRLLRGITRELGTSKGPDLPACWIAGFYGSGKSSFAKLLGLSLDGKQLPDGSWLSEAFLARDDSPKRAELVAAWQGLLARVPAPMSVVFDIGSEAASGEHIHQSVLRMVQRRLGYCATSQTVADAELRLEIDGQWESFCELAQKALGRPWTEAGRAQQAEDHFSLVMSQLFPARYPAPGAWFEERIGLSRGERTSVSHVVEAIDAMVCFRAPERSLFIVVDEVSQYVHQNNERMLALQSFVSQLGQRLKGRVWLLATGQQKLEDQAETNNLGKMKDRFPPHLRVHLASTNIRDVVHKRLLKKRVDREETLRALFLQHRPDLRLHGYGCEDISAEDFLEVYPLLPGHVELLMDITTNLRATSTRMQGDDHAIRGLLQLMSTLFQTFQLGEAEVGTLVTLEHMYDVQHSALDSDVQNTLTRIFNEPSVREDKLAMRVAKVVSLLQLVRETRPTTAELIAKCLYQRLGDGNQLPAVTAALEKLLALSLLSLSATTGYKLQSSAGQEWQKEREDLVYLPEETSKLVQRTLPNLVGNAQERPKHRNRAFPWQLLYSDGRQAVDVRLADPRGESTIAVHFQLRKATDCEPARWVRESGDKEGRKDTVLFWIVEETKLLEEKARELWRSTRMIERQQAKRETPGAERQRLLIDEQQRAEELTEVFKRLLAEALLQGTVYFRGQVFRPREKSTAFAGALLALGNQLLPELYPQFFELAILPGELLQLLEPDLAGASTKLTEAGLGILRMDAGKLVPTCEGALPRLIEERVKLGVSAQTLLAQLMGPPHGLAPDVVKACVAGLLRAKKLRIRPQTGDVISSYKDPGARDVLVRDRDFRASDLLPASGGGVPPRGLVAIRSLFEDKLGVTLERDEEAIADAAFAHFPDLRKRLREVERKYEALPGRPQLPPELGKLPQALERCMRSRQVEDTVQAVYGIVDVLRDGLEAIALTESELTDAAIATLRAGDRVLALQASQLDVSGLDLPVERTALDAHVATLRAARNAERPWKHVDGVRTSAAALTEAYVTVRRGLLDEQARKAEIVRQSVKSRAGFALLSADQAHRVLRPVTQAMHETTDFATDPTLGQLRDGFEAALERAHRQADDLLDEILSAATREPVVKVEARLQGRELASREELKTLLGDLEERLGPLLDAGKRVRLT